MMLQLCFSLYPLPSSVQSRKRVSYNQQSPSPPSRSLCFPAPLEYTTKRPCCQISDARPTHNHSKRPWQVHNTLPSCLLEYPHLQIDPSLQHPKRVDTIPPNV